MTRTEAITLSEYVSAACPQQRMSEFTPDIWADILADPTLDWLTFNDARAAVIAIKRRQPFVDPSAIIDQARRTLRETLDRQRTQELRNAEQQRLQLTPAASRTRTAMPRTLSAEVRATLDQLRARRTTSSQRDTRTPNAEPTRTTP